MRIVPIRAEGGNGRAAINVSVPRRDFSSLSLARRLYIIISARERERERYGFDYFASRVSTPELAFLVSLPLQ